MSAEETGSAPPSEGLRGLREEISAVDGELLSLLVRRTALSRQVARWKVRSGSPLRDPHREREILLDLERRGQALGLDPAMVLRVFQSIVEGSLVVQQQELAGRLREVDPGAPWRVAFLGAGGSWSHVAAMRLAQREGRFLVPCGAVSFSDVVRLVSRGEADAAVLPLENSSTGVLHEVLDLLQQSSLPVVGEVQVSIDHALVARTGTAFESIRRVLGHPQALAQCRNLLSSLPRAEQVLEMDTATAARRVLDAEESGWAALAAPETARALGLEVLRESVTDHPDNRTRFVAIARKAWPRDSRLPARTGLLVSIEDQPGALAELLAVFRDHGLDLAHLQSRRRTGRVEETCFYVEVNGDAEQPTFRRALDALGRLARTVDVLGVWARWDWSDFSHLQEGGGKSSAAGEKPVDGEPGDGS